MMTIGECVGGPMDGLQLDPPDEDEPDDWPDSTVIEDDYTGTRARYYIDSKQLKTGRPTVRGKYRVWFFIYEDLIDAQEDNL